LVPYFPSGVPFWKTWGWGGGGGLNTPNPPPLRYATAQYVTPWADYPRRTVELHVRLAYFY
jgi:hypothetical protein